MAATLTDILVDLEKLRAGSDRPREFRPRSVWEIVCECGIRVQSHEREFTCPHCQRRLSIPDTSKQPA